jgi:hypothetical protein
MRTIVDLWEGPDKPGPQTRTVAVLDLEREPNVRGLVLELRAVSGQARANIEAAHWDDIVEGKWRNLAWANVERLQEDSCTAALPVEDLNIIRVRAETRGCGPFYCAVAVKEETNE